MAGFSIMLMNFILIPMIFLALFVLLAIGALAAVGVLAFIHGNALKLDGPVVYIRADSASLTNELLRGAGIRRSTILYPENFRSEGAGPVLLKVTMKVGADAGELKERAAALPGVHGVFDAQ